LIYNTRTQSRCYFSDGMVPQPPQFALMIVASTVPKTPLINDAKHAFVTELEKSHGSALRRYLAARMRNAAADVPDLVQEVYLRLLRLENHEAIRNSQAYLYTVASHVLHQHALRRATGEAAAVNNFALELGRAESDPDPALQLEVEQQFELLGARLKEISPKAYATLILHRCHGLPLQEVSEKLGASYSMTKKYLAKALKYIEAEIEAGREAS
jgi:RNA polymerase sigma factor (sigma-70 family)